MLLSTSRNTKQYTLIPSIIQYYTVLRSTTQDYAILHVNMGYDAVIHITYQDVKLKNSVTQY